MRRRRLSLQEKVFLVRNYYSNEMSSPIAQERFNAVYKVKTTEAILICIEKLIKRFESTGSVQTEVYLESGTVIKDHQEQRVTSKVKIKKEKVVKNEIPEDDQILPEVINSTKTEEADSNEFYQVDEEKGSDEPFYMHSLGDVSEVEEEEEKDDDEEDEKQSQLDSSSSEDTEDSDYEEKDVKPKRIRKSNNNGKKQPREDPSFTPGRECNTCGKISATSKAHYAHLATHRTKKYSCTICGRPARTNAQRMAHELCHISNWEAAGSGHSCSICGRNFMLAKQLAMHKKVHRKVTYKNKICEICGKGLVGNSSLALHMRSHTGERPFACKLCPKTFAILPSLTIHIRSHTGERPYKCEECGKRFIDPSTLRVHKRQHTGENPYVCQFCGKSCKQGQNLRSHIRHIHKIDLSAKEISKVSA